MKFKFLFQWFSPYEFNCSGILMTLSIYWKCYKFDWAHTTLGKNNVVPFKLQVLIYRIIPSRIFLYSSLETLRRILQWLFWRTSNATKQWWFSSGDISLYRRANSVLAFICVKKSKCAIYYNNKKMLYYDKNNMY